MKGVILVTINHIRTTHADAAHIIHLIVCMAACGGCIKRGMRPWN